MAQALKTAFLGLGVMGYPMARHLHEKGYDLAVWNRTRAKAESFAREIGGLPADDPAAAVRDRDVVFLCLGDDPDVRAVVEALEGALKPGAILVDHTTASPGLAREFAQRLAQRDAEFVDAPVSGGQAGAENGRLAIMCGGGAEAIEKARAPMSAYGARIVHIGPAGHGQLAKSVNQICIAGILQGLAEGVHFAETAGLDIERVLEAISGGAAQSWQMDNRARTMARDVFDFGFAVDWMRKDLRIALEEARANGARLPVAALVDQFYSDVQCQGGGRLDTSSLVKRFRKA